MIAYDKASIGNRLARQDNRMTFMPVFVVEERRRIHGVSDDYAEKFVWIDDSGETADDETAAALDADPDAYPLSGWNRIGVADVWQFSQVFFTQEGAKEYIARHAHNLCEPRVYVYSGSNNPEWLAATDLLMLERTGAQPLPF